MPRVFRMIEYTYKFKATSQLWDCCDCPLFNDDFASCNATGSKYPRWGLRQSEPRMPDCPLEENDLNIIDMEEVKND